MFFFNKKKIFNKNGKLQNLYPKGFETTSP